MQDPKWVGLASDSKGFSAHLNWAREQVLKEKTPTEQSNIGYDAGGTYDVKALIAKLSLLVSN